MKLLFYIFSTFFFVFKTYSQEQINFYFDNNKYELNSKELERFEKWISENKTSKILSITGSTDEVGTSGYNDTLSQKRVNFIFSKIKGIVKIREDFKSISLGEKGAINKNKAENRRAIIHFLLEKDLAKESEIVGIEKKEVIQPKKVAYNLPSIEEEAMNFPENASLEEKFNLSKPGVLIKLKDVNFYQNSFAVLPSSKKSIDELLDLLDKYPKLKIEIQGHICCIADDRINLSLQRAKQVRRILVSEGINIDRLFVKGYGTTKPKFPIPEANEVEAGANRRVEIMILEK